MPPQTPAAVINELLAMPPGATRTGMRMLAPATDAAAAAVSAPHKRPITDLVRMAARLVLRSSRAKQLVLSLLARAPRLHARALAIMFAPSNTIALDPEPVAPFQRFAKATQGQRLRLAFVSPLPPARTGIADYAAQLLPALMERYDIVLVAQQATITLPSALATLPVEDAAWLRLHAHTFDHILYQIGNSEFHSHMFALLRDLPGVVVLHDFYLGNVMAYRQARLDPPGAWTGALFHSHGYPALCAYQATADRTALFKAYPCNLAVLQQATAIIHHSSHAAELARDWYGQDATRNWHSVPLPRAAPPMLDRAAARAALGIADDVFLVCSFGHIVPNKLGERLLAAWLASTLQVSGRCLLVLVGAIQDSPFGAHVASLVATSQGRVRIAGWSDETVYRQYLQAADLGVQLRTRAQGETSAAVLDCMNYGLATIVNANGSMAGLPEDAVLRLPDTFGDAELVDALEALYEDDAYRVALSRRAAQLLSEAYRPEHAVTGYAVALCKQTGGQPPHVRQLLVDVGDGSAEQHSVLTSLLVTTDVRVELVRLVLENGTWHIRYARCAAGALLGLTWAEPVDPLARLARGDILYCCAATAATDEAGKAGFWDELRAHGLALAFGWDDADVAAYNTGCSL